MTKRRHIVMSVMIVSGLWIAGCASFAQDMPLQTYRWQNFQFTYPQHWSIVLDQDAGEAAHHVKLIANQDETHSVFMTGVTQDLKTPDNQGF